MEIKKIGIILFLSVPFAMGSLPICSSRLTGIYEKVSGRVTKIRNGDEQFPVKSYLTPDNYSNYSFSSNAVGDHISLLAHPERNTEKNWISQTGNNIPPKNSLPDIDALMRARSEVKTTEGIKLANFGDERYFWFIPDGQTQRVPARILDINRDPSHDYGKVDSGVIIFVEYLEVTTNFETISHIAELTQNEFRTLVRAPHGLGISEAKMAFQEVLSLVELETKKYAAKLKMQLFGFSSFYRGDTLRGSNNIRTSLETMNNMSWHAIDVSITQRWGDISDLKNGQENISDVFSRLNPRYVLDRFYATNDFVYSWVITEDGALKIIPKMPVGNNLKAQILRLAAGKRIYAGGDFTINSDGSLNILTRSNDFQIVYEGWNNRGAFEADNPHLKEFIAGVFKTQGRVNIARIDAEDAPSYAKVKDFSNGEQERQNFKRVGWDGDSRFVEDIVEQTDQTYQSRKLSTWNIETELPKNFEEWLVDNKITASDHQRLKIIWAHYLFHSTPSMSLKEIKKSYRSLSRQFHPDTYRGENADVVATKVQQMVVEAWEILSRSAVN